MTVKAKRAKALPLLDTATSLAIGELVDESIPADVEALIQGFGGQFGSDFQAWLCSRIGVFRAMHALPATHEEKRAVEVAGRATQESVLRLENLTPAAEAYMEHFCQIMLQRPFKGPDGLLTEFQAIADKATLVLEATEERLGSLPERRGRRSAAPRDHLLADVANYLLANSVTRITKREAAEHASSLLDACGIDVPWGRDEVERLIRRLQKGGK